MKNVLLAFSLFVSLLPFSPSAHAATPETNCIPRNVAWSADGGNRFMYLICTNNTVHVAYEAGSDCPKFPIDTLKIWHSTGLAAKLASKPVTVWWNSVTCAGTSPKRVISGIELTP